MEHFHDDIERFLQGRDLERQAALAAIQNTPTERFQAQRRELDERAAELGVSAREIAAAIKGRPDLPRPLLPRERETLFAILRHADFPGRDALVAQVDEVQVSGYCPCTCATVDLSLPRDSRVTRAHEAPAPIPNEAVVLDDCGEPIGGILVFVDDLGRLECLEIYSFEDPISPLPPLERLELSRSAR